MQAQLIKKKKRDNQMFAWPVDHDLGSASWTWPSMPPCRQKLIDFKMFDPHKQYFKRGGHMPLMCFLGAIASNVGQRSPPTDGHGGQKKGDGGAKQRGQGWRSADTRGD